MGYCAEKVNFSLVHLLPLPGFLNCLLGALVAWGGEDAGRWSVTFRLVIVFSVCREFW